MIALLAAAAGRTLVLALLVWAAIKVFRIRDARLQSTIWATVLVGGFSMPALLHWKLVPTAAFIAPALAIQGPLSQAPYASMTISVSIYVIVVLVLLFRFALGAGRMWRLRTEASIVSEPWAIGADVRAASCLSSPVTFGATILLPSDHVSWTDLKRTIVLAHERSHVQHHDCYVQWLAALHLCVFWFSPLAWWLRRHLAQLAEFASDDAVLLAGFEKSDYAATLLEVARKRSEARLSVSMSAGALSSRIERILSSERMPHSSTRSRRALSMAATSFAAAFAAATGSAVDAQSRGDRTASNFGMDVRYPHIVASPSPEELRKWYPVAAARADVGGLVQVTVALDGSGRPTNSVVVSEDPPKMGFGAAAYGLTKVFTYANPTGEPASLTYKIKFALDRGHP